MPKLIFLNICKTIIITNGYTGRALRRLGVVLTENKLVRYVKINQPMVI